LPDEATARAVVKKTEKNGTLSIDKVPFFLSAQICSLPVDAMRVSVYY
jgi:hypothetical protein